MIYVCTRALVTVTAMYAPFGNFESIANLVMLGVNVDEAYQAFSTGLLLLALQVFFCSKSVGMTTCFGEH